MATNVHHYNEFGIIWVKFDTDAFLNRLQSVHQDWLLDELLPKQEEKEKNGTQIPPPPPNTHRDSCKSKQSFKGARK